MMFGWAVEQASRTGHLREGRLRSGLEREQDRVGVAQIAVRAYANIGTGSAPERHRVPGAER
jgi:hypothetical protein